MLRPADRNRQLISCGEDPFDSLFVKFLVWRERNMNLHILALFLLAKLASCEIEDATSLTQSPGNDPPDFYTFLQTSMKMKKKIWKNP